MRILDSYLKIFLDRKKLVFQKDSFQSSAKEITLHEDWKSRHRTGAVKMSKCFWLNFYRILLIFELSTNFFCLTKIWVSHFPSDIRDSKWNNWHEIEERMIKKTSEFSALHLRMKNWKNDFLDFREKRGRNFDGGFFNIQSWENFQKVPVTLWRPYLGLDFWNIKTSKIRKLYIGKKNLSP